MSSDLHTRPAELDDPAFVLRHLASIGHHFNRVGKVWQACCCFHVGDHTPSLTLHADGGLYCYACGWAGSIVDYLIDRAAGQRDDKAAIRRAFGTLGLSHGRPFRLPPLPQHFATPAPSAPPPPNRAPDCVHPWYDRTTGARVMERKRWYLTADEQPRYDGDAKVIRPYDARTGRMGEPKDVDLAIYGWPALQAADPGRLVLVTESESDADAVTRAGGLCVATGGASRWRDPWGPDLAGHSLALVPHNDAAGQAWADKVAAQLHPYAARIVVLHLPNLAEGGDVRDFLSAGNTINALEVLAAYVAPLERGQLADPAQNADWAELARVTAERDALLAWKAGVEAILDKQGLDMTDRVGLLALQRIADQEQLPQDELVEVSQQEWAKQYGVPTSTMSRWLDRWEAMGLVKHRAGPDPRYPIIDRRTGKPRLTRRGEPMYENRTHLACTARPFEVVATVKSPVMSQSGLGHGGARARICPNPECDGTADDQTDFHGKRCTKCGTVYAMNNRETRWHPVTKSQDESTEADKLREEASYSQSGTDKDSSTPTLGAEPPLRDAAAALRQHTDNPRIVNTIWRVRSRLHRADQDAAVNEYAHHRARDPNPNLKAHPVGATP